MCGVELSKGSPRTLKDHVSRVQFQLRLEVMQNHRIGSLIFRIQKNPQQFSQLSSTSWGVHSLRLGRLLCHLSTYGAHFQASLSGCLLVWPMRCSIPHLLKPHTLPEALLFSEDGPVARFPHNVTISGWAAPCPMPRAPGMCVAVFSLMFF